MNFPLNYILKKSSNILLKFISKHKGTRVVWESIVHKVLDFEQMLSIIYIPSRFFLEICKISKLLSDTQGFCSAPGAGPAGLCSPLRYAKPWVSLKILILANFEEKLEGISILLFFVSHKLSLKPHSKSNQTTLYIHSKTSRYQGWNLVYPGKCNSFGQYV